MSTQARKRTSERERARARARTRQRERANERQRQRQRDREGEGGGRGACAPAEPMFAVSDEADSDRLSTLVDHACPETLSSHTCDSFVDAYSACTQTRKVLSLLPPRRCISVSTPDPHLGC
jgi:hypothetical protein